MTLNFLNGGCDKYKPWNLFKTLESKISEKLNLTLQGNQGRANATFEKGEWSSQNKIVIGESFLCPLAVSKAYKEPE